MTSPSKVGNLGLALRHQLSKLEEADMNKVANGILQELGKLQLLASKCVLDTDSSSVYQNDIPHSSQISESDLISSQESLPRKKEEGMLEKEFTEGDLRRRRVCWTKSTPRRSREGIECIRQRIH